MQTSILIKLMGLTAVVTLTVSIARADVDVFTWTGAGGNNEWLNAGNWEAGLLPTGAATSGTREIVINNVANLPSLITSTVNYNKFTYNGTQDLTISTHAVANDSPTDIGHIYNNSGHNLTIANERVFTNISVKNGMVTLTGTVRGNVSITPVDASGNGVMIVNGYLYSEYGKISVGIPWNGTSDYTTTLAGTGTVRGGGSDGGVNILAPSNGSANQLGGILAPGDPNANGGIGKLTVTGSLLINAASTIVDSGGRLELQLNSPSSFDQLDVTTNMIFNSGNSDRFAYLNLIFDPNTIALGAYDLITYGGVLSGFGNDISSESPDWTSVLRWYTGVEDHLAALTEAGYTWSLSNILNETGGIIRFEIIPEPSTFVLLGMGLLTLVLLRRKPRKSANHAN